MNRQQLIAYPQGTTEPITYPTGEVVLDLFKDEPIPLVLNVDDFTNVAEADASYSLPMELPGTKKNNIFFNHIYNITSDSNFNPHKKTKIVVKEGTINTFEGYMQLNEIVVKEGTITYEIILFSEAVNLKTILSERVFRDLDLSELNHLYDKNNIKNSWTGVLSLFNTLPADSFAGSGTTTDVLKYPFVRWKNFISSSSNTFFINKYNTFRAWINALYLVKNIFRDAGYTFTSTFLNSTDFSKLYNDFNTTYDDATFNSYALANEIIGTYTSTSSILNATSVSGSQSALFNTTTDKFTAVNNGTDVEVSLLLDLLSSSNTIEISLHHTNTSYSTNLTSGAIIWSGVTPNYTINVTPPNILLDNGDSLWLEMKTTSGSVQVDTTSAFRSITFNINALSSVYLDNLLLGYKGDVNQWEYLKSFIDMFKLVIIQDDANANNLIIEPYKDWVDTGNLVDLTNKVDLDEIKYKPIEGLAKNIALRFVEDSDDWITPNHKQPSIWKYGYNNITDLEIFDKDEELIEIPSISDTIVTSIEATSSSDIVIPQIISSVIGAGGQPEEAYWESNLRVLYDNGVQTLSGADYSELPINTSEFYNESDYLLFSAVKDYPITPTSKSIRFNTIAEDYSPQIVLNNLYNVYWAKYLDELYHKDTRIVTLEAYLNADDISKIKFNDIILIKNKKYRLHKIDYRAGSMSKIELITIKDL